MEKPQGWWELAVPHCPDPNSLGTEWWDDRLHARGGSKTWDSLPPSKRKKAPLVSGILHSKSPETGQDKAALDSGKCATVTLDHSWSFGITCSVQLSAISSTS